MDAARSTVVAMPAVRIVRKVRVGSMRENWDSGELVMAGESRGVGGEKSSRGSFSVNAKIFHGPRHVHGITRDTCLSHVTHRLRDLFLPCSFGARTARYGQTSRLMRRVFRACQFLARPPRSA